MKKKLVKTSLNGIISERASRLNSDSDMANPAKNAPSANESPAFDVKYAIIKHIPKIQNKNNSLLRSFAAS